MTKFLVALLSTPVILLFTALLVKFLFSLYAGNAHAEDIVLSQNILEQFNYVFLQITFAFMGVCAAVCVSLLVWLTLFSSNVFYKHNAREFG